MRDNSPNRGGRMMGNSPAARGGHFRGNSPPMRDNQQQRGYPWRDDSSTRDGPIRDNRQARGGHMRDNSPMRGNTAMTRDRDEGGVWDRQGGVSRNPMMGSAGGARFNQGSNDMSFRYQQNSGQSLWDQESKQGYKY